MKLFTYFCLAAMAFAQSAGAQAKTEARNTATRGASAVKLPAGATQTAMGTWSYTDPQSARWIYRDTPWGLSRASADSPSARVAPASQDRASEITATEADGTVQFARPGPFGIYRWTKQKSALADDEKAAMGRSRGNAASALPAQERQ